MKVFGIGWSKTGTTTLGSALQTLGFNPQHNNYDTDLIKAVGNKEWDKVWQVTDNVESMVEWPCPLIYRQLAERYPSAKFVLTTRCYVKRFESYCKHVDRYPPVTPDVDEARIIQYGVSDPENHANKIRLDHVAHDSAVGNYFNEPCQPFGATDPSKLKRLLVVDWELGDGWERLCGFLDVPVPNQPFPHEHKASS
jgi:hypothetical protein